MNELAAVASLFLLSSPVVGWMEKIADEQYGK